MFVGFDSRNTSNSFLHYLNWNLEVWEIPLFGFRELVVDTTAPARRRMVVLLLHFTATASHPQ
jgi:hypothetical protein